MLAVSAAAARRDFAEGDRLPGRLRRADLAANQSRHLALPRPVAGISRPQVDGHLSPRLPLAKPGGEIRSVERSAKSDVGPRPGSEKKQSHRTWQAFVTRHGSSS